ncbi:related to channel protein [Melanopsichium pennsylvanicum]|uniref:Related to channel protein n=2 Tax=Melanopsichium pennsylvanicum TaxID=63383 RepID=A0AAJ4XKR7_9BASI|nr:related to channel protein [Melanopsichium pennsylvanicum 4]SNX82913.1 related to channel protein [Melanopsichium pennsylvanicum]
MRSRRSSMAVDELASTAADIAIPIEINLPGRGSASNSANHSQVDLTGRHIYLPEHGSGESSTQGGMFELKQVQPHEQVSECEVIKDIKTGKHYKTRPVFKPAYSLGHTTGAPAVSGVGVRSSGRIGLGHAFPTEEQTKQYKAEKAARRSNNSSGTRSPSGAGGSGTGQRTSMDVNTLEGRAQLFSQLRELIHEEFEKVNRDQTEELRRHVHQAHLEQQKQLEGHIEDVKEIIATEPTFSEDGAESDDTFKKLKSSEATETAIVTTNDAKLCGRKGSDGTLSVDAAVQSMEGTMIRDPQPAERGFGAEEEQVESDEEYEFPNKWAAIRYKLREPFAEFLGCFLLMVFGNGINCQVVVSKLYDPSDAKGDYLSISFGWGVGVAMGVWVAGGISGGMINPAVTIALACFRKFPWKKVPIYIIAQILGCLMGSLCIYGLYVNPIRIIDPLQTEKTASLFTTYPAEFLRQPSTRMSAFYNEFFASTILLIVILAIGDSSNTPPPDGLAPLVLLWLVWGLGACLGWQTAYAVNPARDLGPRIMLYIVGYSPSILWTFNAWYWLWTPILATCSGAIMGCIVYDTLCYTGGDSPLNFKVRRNAPAFAPGSKQKMPAALSKA